MTDFSWASLEEDIGTDGTFKPPVATPGKYAKTERYPCQKCGGSGQYRGVRRHQPASECFACGGKGYFMTSATDRAKARQQRQASKERKLAEARAAFDEQNPGIGTFLSGATWSPFAQDLLGKLRQYGSLTDGQLHSVRNMQQACAARAAERDAARTEQANATATPVDLTPIRVMFEAAAYAPLKPGAVGRKPPVYRAAGLIIKRALDHGKNPGALYVTRGDDYLGKIIGTTYSGNPEAMTSLLAIAADPRGEAVRFGREFGVCSCCGRELTDTASIAAGIGPICATKWGL